jgi:hypothetical protein
VDPQHLEDKETLWQKYRRLQATVVVARAD